MRKASSYDSITPSSSVDLVLLQLVALFNVASRSSCLRCNSAGQLGILDIGDRVPPPLRSCTPSILVPWYEAGRNALP